MSRTAVDGDRRAVAGGWHALIAIVHLDRRTIRAGRGRRTPAARGLPVAGNEGDRNDDTSHGHCRGGGSAAGHRNRACHVQRQSWPGRRIGTGRSEEHTSELQSLMRISYAVFCLKKKKQTDTARK